MSAALRPLRASGWPSAPWWLVLAAALTLAFAVHPLAGFGLLALLAVEIALPLDFLASYLLCLTAASFVNYTRGQLTSELALLTIGLVFMLGCYALAGGRRLLALPRAPMTLPMMLYLVLSLGNFVRGMVAGNSLRYGGLEILAVFAMMSALLVANRFTADRLKFALGWLLVTAFGHSALGFYIYSIIKVRTGSIYFTPVPGVVGVVLLNHALRAPTRRRALLWALAGLPLLLHQFLSFTRGYWLGIIGSTLVSVMLFVGRGPGVRARAGRVGLLLASTVVAGVLGAVVLAMVYNIHGLGELALSRLSSSTGTRYSFETSSNIVRLVEYGRVLGDIARAPLFGHGLGYYFVVREPIHLKLLEQWFCHENYLLVWLKQGLIGLGLFLWILVAGVRTGLRCMRSPDPAVVSWGAGTAAATVYVIIYCLVHFPLAEVNTTFTMAMLWGGATALCADGWRTLTWSRGPEDAAPGADTRP